MSEGENGSHPRDFIKLKTALINTGYRIKYALMIKDYVCLQDCFKKLNIQFHEFRKTTKHVTENYICALVKLEKALLINDEHAITKKRKRTHRRENADALSSCKEILIKCLKQYEDSITKYKACNANDNEYREKWSNNSMFGPDTDTYDSSDESQPRAEYWVKDHIEIEWGRVQKKFKHWSTEKPQLKKLQQLRLLRRYATTPSQELKIIFEIIDTLLRFNQNHYKSMSNSLWEVCLHYMIVALDILAQHSKIFLTDHYIDEYETMKTAAYKRRVRVTCNLVDVLTRIYNEFYRRLNFIDPHTACYEEKLKDEAILFLLSHNVFDYLVATKNTKGAVKAALLRAELVCYKSQEEYNLLLKLVDSRYFPHLSKSPVNCREFMDEMVSFIYKKRGYDFSNGSEWKLNSKLNVQVVLMSESIKIQFNRAMAQLGLCAFRTGHYKEAYNLLYDLFEDGRMEDLLAQGIDVDYKQMPYHKHINLELLEGVHLICAMIMGHLERRPFKARSVNIFSQVMVANRALEEGNFNKSFKIIESLNFWVLVRNHSNVFEMIKTRSRKKH